MNWKTWVPLALAIVLGLAAMKVAHDVVGRRNGGTKVESGTPIVVVKNDLPAGSKISPEDLTTVRVNSDTPPAAVFTAPGELEGRVLTATAPKGAPVVESMLAPKGAGSGLQALVPEGMRAVTLEINEFSGVAGNLAVGCRVDVVSTINGQGGEMISRTIVQNVKVQAIGINRPENDQTGPSKSVTLIATPKEAEAIELASATGRPRLVLRNYNDSATPDSNGVTVAELRQGGVHKDPFAVAQVIENAAPATTQPFVAGGFMKFRNVKIIRAGIESQVTLEEPLKKDDDKPAPKSVGTGLLTGTSTEELPSTGVNGSGH